MATSVSGDSLIIRGWLVAACLAWSGSLVSASSWSEHRFGSTAVVPRGKDTAFSPSLNPPARMTFCEGPNRTSSWSLKESQRNSAKCSWFFVFEMNFVHCFGTGMDPLWIFTSRELDSPLLLHFSALIETGRYWSKTGFTWVQPFRLNVLVTISLYFSNNSPNGAQWI